MAYAYCPRCGKAMSSGYIICPKCTDELNALGASRRKWMSLVFTLIIVAIIYIVYRSGRLDGVLKIFKTLTF